MYDFRNAMLTHGLQPPEYIRPCVFERFPGNGKGPSNNAGWCHLFDNGRGGVYGDFSTGLSQTWRADEDKQTTPAEIAENKRILLLAKKQRKSETAKKNQKAVKQAKRLLSTRKLETGDHRYLCDKNIQVQPSSQQT